MRYSILILFLFACSSDYTPKPRAYFKIDLPKKEYSSYIGNSFLLEYPTYSKIEIKKNIRFIDVNFHPFSGKLHTTFVKLDNDLLEHIEQSRSLAYKHNNQADVISEQIYIDEKNNVYGMLYDYEGVTATSMQFYLTDSLENFFRGSFYFNTEINDSIIPVNNFVKSDIRNLIESFRWK